MSNKNKEPSKSRIPQNLIKKALATTALGAVLYPIGAQNVERVFANGKVPAPKHNLAGQPLSKGLKVGGSYHQVSFSLGPHGRIWDAAELVAKDSGQDVREASDNIETYLPDQVNHFTQPNQNVTVDENSKGEVIPKPTD